MLSIAYSRWNPTQSTYLQIKYFGVSLIRNNRMQMSFDFIKVVLSLSLEYAICNNSVFGDDEDAVRPKSYLRNNHLLPRTTVPFMNGYGFYNT